MESSYLLERKIISLCFNTIRDSVFILSLINEKLSLTEEDLTKSLILRRFKLLKLSECQIQNTNYKQLPKDTYEGYSLYFWSLSNKIFVIYPFGYITIFDYNSGTIVNHFQCHGKRAYVIRNIVCSPMENSMFISAQQMRNVYHINYENIKNGITYQKLVLPQGETVFDLVCHPNEKYIFVACSDSIVHIFDYSDITKIKEVKNGIVDVPLTDDGKVMKNQAEVIKNNNLMSVITIDINTTGNFLLTGNENGTIYLWDAFMAMKEKRVLFTKEHISFSGILSLKFLRTKQFQNLERFICLAKEGKFSIFSIMNKENSIGKNYIFNQLYENSTYNPIIYPLVKYNLITSNFINISNFTNVISFTWPNLKIEKIKNGDKLENYLLFTNFSAKFFFFYDNDFPKINFPLSTQMKFKSYEEYIPTNKNQVCVENKIFMVDNFFIYSYDVQTGTNKKIVNYAKEFNLKNVYPLKFDVKSDPLKIQEEGENTETYIPLTYFFILIENENNRKITLIIAIDLLTNTVKKTTKFDDVIDFVLLGTSTNIDTSLMIHKDKHNAILYTISANTREMTSLDASVVRVYNTPFNNGNCVLYRNVLNELKFSDNLTNAKNDITQFKCVNTITYKLDFSEREIDVLFTTYDNNIYCAISMIEKIVITDDKMKPLYTFKTSLNENPNLISSMFWIGKTLLYAKGNSINYFYGDDNINQKLFTNNRGCTFIAGVLPDRFILVSRSGKEIDNVVLTTPMINPLEPILIGYLDSPHIDYNLIRECVVNMFTNQISQNLVDKFIAKDLKEVAWMFISDTKSSFQNIDKKIQILNDLLQFDKVLENIITTKDLKNEMDLDELIWKFHYDQSVDYIKNLLQNETKVLIQYGQFDKAVKILELLGDYPATLNLLMLSASKEEYERLRVMFQAKGCLSFTENLLINNAFCLQYKQDESNVYNMNHYNKVFDNYRNEHFLFGANQDKFNVESIKNVENKINKKTSYITNLSKKILPYGENSYTIYADVFNKETNKKEQSAICTLVLQKIEQFYGSKNTIYEDKGNVRAAKKPNFQDFTIPLTQVSVQNTTLANNENDDEIVNPYGDEDDFEIDPNINSEEISENLYLTAYYHCDKGSGFVVEDITDNLNEAKLSFVNPEPDPSNPNTNVDNDEGALWTNVLDEFEPLEYEDKWGRKSPGAHAIRFSKKYQTKMIIKSSPSLITHLNKKFTIEMWVKLNSINVTLFTSHTFNFEIQNGQFKISLQNNLIQGEKVKDYSLPLNKFVHIAVIYRKKAKKVEVYENCDLVAVFDISLDGVPSTSDIIIGNAALDAELTEIKIWNQAMPITYLKENYKSPLPILAENKRKLRMKINKQDDTQPKKKFGFGQSNFVFGANNNESKISKPNFNFGSSSIMSSNNNPASISNTKGMYDFNPGELGGNELENSVAYPSLTSVMEEGNNKSISNIHMMDTNKKSINGIPFAYAEQTLQFGVNFDEINNQNFDTNNQINNNDGFNFQVNDFNFDK